jgi:large subunit ribosomal protein L5
MASKLKDKYFKEVIPALKKELGFTNIHQVPKLEKIVINMGLGEAVTEPKLIEGGVYTVTRISGQKPVIRNSRKAISNFKLKEKAPIGVSVTLRREKMYEFFERLIVAALPRVRDFRGVSAKSFDGHGNYTLGLKEQLLFPEVEYEKIGKPKGMNICIVTTAKTDAHAKALLTALGMPIRN